MRIKISNPTPQGIQDILQKICEHYKVNLATVNIYLSLHDNICYYDFFDLYDESAYISLDNCSLEENGIVLTDSSIKTEANDEYIFLEKGLISKPKPKAKKPKTPM